MGRPRSPDVNTGRLRALGKALYGSYWQSQLARDLGVSLRTVARYASGESGVPDRVVEQAESLARDRIRSLTIAVELSDKSSDISDQNSQAPYDAAAPYNFFPISNYSENIRWSMKVRTVVIKPSFFMSSVRSHLIDVNRETPFDLINALTHIPMLGRRIGLRMSETLEYFFMIIRSDDGHIYLGIFRDGNRYPLHIFGLGDDKLCQLQQEILSKYFWYLGRDEHPFTVQAETPS